MQNEYHDEYGTVTSVTRWPFRTTEQARSLRMLRTVHGGFPAWRMPLDSPHSGGMLICDLEPVRRITNAGDIERVSDPLNQQHYLIDARRYGTRAL